jgi:hypothetical protein
VTLTKFITPVFGSSWTEATPRADQHIRENHITEPAPMPAGKRFLFEGTWYVVSHANYLRGLLSAFEVGHETGVRYVFHPDDLTVDNRVPRHAGARAVWEVMQGYPLSYIAHDAHGNTTLRNGNPLQPMPDHLGLIDPDSVEALLFDGFIDPQSAEALAIEGFTESIHQLDQTNGIVRCDWPTPCSRFAPRDLPRNYLAAIGMVELVDGTEGPDHVQYLIDRVLWYMLGPEEYARWVGAYNAGTPTPRHLNGGGPREDWVLNLYEQYGSIGEPPTGGKILSRELALIYQNVWRRWFLNDALRRLMGHAGYAVWLAAYNANAQEASDDRWNVGEQPPPPDQLVREPLWNVGFPG